MADLDNKNADFECFTTLKRWLENRNHNKTFLDYFHQCGYQTIAIYGAGDLGNLLYEEVKGSDVHVKYFVDRNAEGMKEIDQIPVITIPEMKNVEDVDVLVITPLGNYDAINQRLTEYMPEMRTISLREAVYEF